MLFYCRAYRDQILIIWAKDVDTKTPSKLLLISDSPLSGEENDLHVRKWILYDMGPLTTARLVGIEFFSSTGLTQPFSHLKLEFGALKNKIGVIQIG